MNFTFTTVVWIAGILVALPLTFWIFRTPHWWRDTVSESGEIRTIETYHLKSRGEMIICYIVSLIPFVNWVYIVMMGEAAGLLNPLKNWLRKPVRSTRID